MFASGFVDASRAPPLLADILARRLDCPEAARGIGCLSSIPKAVNRWRPGDEFAES